jgi:membrane-bound lytic murein transglycosylase B|tara:strand:- start:2081 stop:3070 length:990 start_codon:yes stop_codon:yes gene_type:complete
VILDNTKYLVFLFIFFIVNLSYAEENKILEKYNSEIKEIKSILINKHNINSNYIDTVFQEIKFRKKTLDSMSNAVERKATWERYKKIFITQKRIKEGVAYHKKNYKILQEIEKKYGVPSEVIVAFLGVETNYGKGTGRVKVLDSLATLALQHPRRSKYFKAQLIYFIVLTYQNKLDFNSLYGSYAGAMGAPQFMPESYIKLGVDYNKDGKVDLWNNKYDIYASIANYLVKNGWKKNEAIYSKIKIKDVYVNDIFKDGDVKTVSIENTRLKKILKGNNLNSGKKYLILLSKKNKEYKLGYKNFKVIMSYNPSTFYAMVVSELSEKISQNK